MTNYQFSEALKEIWRFISRMNKYIDECEPWNLFKDETLKNRLSTVMYNLIESLYKIAVLIFPFMPDTAKKITEQLGLDVDFNHLRIEEIKKWGVYPQGNRLNEAEPLFPRIEVNEVEKEFNENPVIENPVTIEDFSKIEIKVVEIMGVSKIEGADRLLKFIVNTGNERRQIISGIAKWYPDEKELIGKKVMAVLNLKPAEFKGEISQGMLLTTAEKKKIKLIEIDSGIKLGTNIK